MNRDLPRRISQAERLLPGVVERRRKRRERLKDSLPFLARIHATAVAAMVLHGEPKFEEPLQHCWTRTLTHHYSKPYEAMRQACRIFNKTEAEQGGVVNDYEPAIAELQAEELPKYRIHELTPERYVYAAQSMHSDIMNGAEEQAARFTEIFKTAPPWLLEFTFTFLDAKVLKFDLPDLSAAPEFGDIGLRDAFRWPLLPLGVMTEGHLAPSQEPDFCCSVEDCRFILETLAKPVSEVTRIEWRRLLAFGLNRELDENVFVLKRQDATWYLEELRRKALHALFKRVASPDISENLLLRIAEDSLTEAGEIDLHAIEYPFPLAPALARNGFTGQQPRPEPQEHVASSGGGVASAARPVVTKPALIRKIGNVLEAIEHLKAAEQRMLSSGELKKPFAADIEAFKAARNKSES